MEPKQIVEDLEHEAQAMMELAEAIKRGGASPLTSEDWNMIRRASMYRLQDALQDIAFMFLTGMESDNLLDNAARTLKYFSELTGKHEPRNRKTK